jgi:hypothetical protein
MVLYLVVAVCGCDSYGPIGDGIVYDPCSPLAVVATDPATEAERTGIADAVALWNAAGVIGLTVDTDGDGDGDGEADRIAVSFEPASPIFYGIYRADRGDIVINHALATPAHRSITIAHELGHAFGLLHVDGSPSLMNEGNLEVGVMARDVDALRALWGSCD